VCETDVVTLAMSYGFRVQVLQNVVLVSSKLDSWKVDIYDDIFQLMHKNTRRNTKEYHYQHMWDREYYDLSDVFDYIQRHDDYVLNRKGMDTKLIKLYAMI